MPRLVGLMLLTAMFANPHFAAGLNGPGVQKLEAADPYDLVPVIMISIKITSHFRPAASTERVGSAPFQVTSAVGP